MKNIKRFAQSQLEMNNNKRTQKNILNLFSQMDKRKILHPCTHMLAYQYSGYLKGFNKKKKPLENEWTKNPMYNEMSKKICYKNHIFYI